MAVASGNLTANGNVGPIDWGGGKGTMFAQGTIDTATVALQFSIDGGNNWVAANDTTGSAASLTAEGHVLFDIGPCKLRINLSSAGASTDMELQLVAHGFGR